MKKEIGKPIGAKFSPGFRNVFDEIRKARPDLNNDNEVAKEAIREMWKNLKKNGSAQI